jgi:hypothetical protein
MIKLHKVESEKCALVRFEEIKLDFNKTSKKFPATANDYSIWPVNNPFKSQKCHRGTQQERLASIKRNI